ncbi:MAG TPA: hypothetical protein DET40_00715 [Lentisphaeria bacterium]|nr:MAG: hypothetical protein A2X45_16785 [Lentisphaerae bacterium GWF2_50_93]HCE42054.1 hypothetical protein [Lentisphaeria bacterium]
MGAWPERPRSNARPRFAEHTATPTTEAKVDFGTKKTNFILRLPFRATSDYDIDINFHPVFLMFSDFQTILIKININPALEVCP